ncbi:MAG: GTP-binding protein [archaeon]
MVEYDNKITDLEKELASTKYNKATQHHIGLVKAKLAKLKEKQEARSSSGRKGDGYSVRKTGDGTVLLLGFPSVGKSTLLNDLTNAASRIGAYDFTTLTVVPGLLEYDSAKIQILDVPGIVKGAASGRGRGKEVLAVMRNADLALIMIDVQHPGSLDIIQKEVYDTGIRLDQKKPDVKIRKTAKNGIRIGKTVKLKVITDDTIKDILKEFRINNADVLIRDSITDDQLIDVIEGNRVYMPSIVVLNKIDLVSQAKLEEVKKKVKPDLCISAVNKSGIEQLKKLIFEKLNLIRIYMKQPKKPADMEEPLIMEKGSTVGDVCEKLHRDFITKFKFVRITGKSAKFPAQKLTLKHVLKDKDIVELHLS